MPENAQLVDSNEAQAALDCAADQEVNRPVEDSSPKTFTAEEVDAKIKARIDKQNARHAEEIAELNKRMQELEERASKADAERDALQKERDMAAWADAAAQQHGVPASILRGSTAEEFMEHAAAIKASISVAPVVRDSGQQPAPSPTKASILAIKDEKARLAAIESNIELFT